MPTSPNLSDEELAKVRKLLEFVRNGLEDFAQGNQKLLHHARRHIMVKLQYDERGTPMERKLLKLTLMAKQQNKCAICEKPLPVKESELDRFLAVDGYTEENCRVVHHECHRQSQLDKNFT